MTAIWTCHISQQPIDSSSRVRRLLLLIVVSYSFLLCFFERKVFVLVQRAHVSGVQCTLIIQCLLPKFSSLHREAVVLAQHVRASRQLSSLCITSTTFWNFIEIWRVWYSRSIDARRVCRRWLEHKPDASENRHLYPDSFVRRLRASTFTRTEKNEQMLLCSPFVILFLSVWWCSKITSSNCARAWLLCVSRLTRWNTARRYPIANELLSIPLTSLTAGACPISLTWWAIMILVEHVAFDRPVRMCATRSNDIQSRYTVGHHRAPSIAFDENVNCSSVRHMLHCTSVWQGYTESCCLSNEQLG